MSLFLASITLAENAAFFLFFLWRQWVFFLVCFIVFSFALGSFLLKFRASWILFARLGVFNLLCSSLPILHQLQSSPSAIDYVCINCLLTDDSPISVVQNLLSFVLLFMMGLIVNLSESRITWEMGLWSCPYPEYITWEGEPCPPDRAIACIGY